MKTLRRWQQAEVLYLFKLLSTVGFLMGFQLHIQFNSICKSLFQKMIS